MIHYFQLFLCYQADIIQDIQIHIEKHDSQTTRTMNMFSIWQETNKGYHRNLNLALMDIVPTYVCGWNH